MEVKEKIHTMASLRNLRGLDLGSSDKTEKGGLTSDPQSGTVTSPQTMRNSNRPKAVRFANQIERFKKKKRRTNQARNQILEQDQKLT